MQVARDLRATVATPPAIPGRLCTLEWSTASPPPGLQLRLHAAGARPGRLVRHEAPRGVSEAGPATGTSEMPRNSATGVIMGHARLRAGLRRHGLASGGCRGDLRAGAVIGHRSCAFNYERDYHPQRRRGGPHRRRPRHGSRAPDGRASADGGASRRLEQDGRDPREPAPRLLALPDERCASFRRPVRHLWVHHGRQHRRRPDQRESLFSRCPRRHETALLLWSAARPSVSRRWPRVTAIAAPCWAGSLHLRAGRRFRLPRSARVPGHDRGRRRPRHSAAPSRRPLHLVSTTASTSPWASCGS